MSSRRNWKCRPYALCLLAAMSVGCRDLPLDVNVKATPPTGAVGFGRIVGCRVEVATGESTCVTIEENGNTTTGVSLNIIANAQWMVETEAGDYTRADSTYRLNVRVVNSQSEALGSPDGTTVTGVKVFLPVRPMGYHGRAAGDTLTDPYGILMQPLQNQNNSVKARNPDGVQRFTGPDQPYWNYAQKLEPGDLSSWREWKFTIHPDVSYFYFAVGIFAAVPGQEWLTSTQAPRAWTISADSVAVLYSPERAVRTHPRLNGPYPRSVLFLGFKRGATVDERQAALDLVRGRVIGGEAGVIYKIVLPDDGTATPLWNAYDRLSKLSQVEMVQPDIMMQGPATFYTLPHDGPGWQRYDWQLSPDSAAGANWSAEAIALPWAWGCSVGDNAVKISVVDGGASHVNAVSSIIRHPTNDSSGIAGVLWRASVTATDFELGGTQNTNSTLATHLEAAFQNGAHVINLSWGAKYLDTIIVSGQTLFAERIASVTQKDSAYAKFYADRFAYAFKQLEALYNVRPLYVVAAGNSQIDAYFSGLPQLATDPVLGQRILVVAAAASAFSAGSTTNRSLWSGSTHPIHRGSSFGSLVSIAAPGANVQASNGSAIVALNGTSFAAPAVTGVAGLLKAFDPRLTADSLKILILAGAARGQRTAGGSIPFLNAYESLRAASARFTAPLCGNRVFTGDSGITVQRNGADPGSMETIIQPGYQPGNLDIRHGGKFIIVASPQSYYSWFNGQWLRRTSLPLAGLDRAPNGSRGSASHYGDTLTSLVGHSLANASVYSGVQLTGPSIQPVQLVNNRPWGPYVPSDEVCVYGWPTSTGAFWCEIRQSPGTLGVKDDYVTLRQPVYSPRGDVVYVGVNWQNATTTYSGWYPCEGSRYCQTATFRKRRIRAEMYSVSVPGGNVALRWSEPDRNVEYLGVSEDGREVLVRSRQLVEEYVTAYGAFPTTTSNVNDGPCTLTYRSATTGQVIPGTPQLPCTTDFAGWAP